MYPRSRSSPKPNRLFLVSRFTPVVILWKFVDNFSSNPFNRHTTNQTNKPKRKQNVLSGGDSSVIVKCCCTVNSRYFVPISRHRESIRLVHRFIVTRVLWSRYTWQFSALSYIYIYIYTCAVDNSALNIVRQSWQSCLTCQWSNRFIISFHTLAKC